MHEMKGFPSGPPGDTRNLTYVCHGDTYMHMRTSLHLPDDLLKRAKKKAAADGRTLTSLIEEGLRIVLSPRASALPAGKRLMPRVSKATGGLMPGFDLAKINTQTEELDDIVRMQRIKRQFK